MSAVLVGVGAPVAGQTAERAPSPTQEQPLPNSPGAEPGEAFEGYVGYVGAGGAGAATPPTDPDEPKSEPLGPVGQNSPESQDVPGQAAAEAEDPAFTAVPLPPAPSPDQTAAVEAAVSESGSARVIVLMRTATRLEADLSGAEIDAQHAEIAESLDGLQATLKDTGSRKVHEFQVVPSAVYEVTAAGLDALLADPNVASVSLDGEVQSQLDSSTGVIDSDLLNATGVLGSNFEGSTGRYDVAIIDSGVDSEHTAFAGRIVREACFVTDSSCPGRTNSSTAPGSGEECTHSTDCDHGTHVGGIAAGSFYTGGHEGVARGAGIVAIKVAQDNPGGPRWTAQFSAIDNALEHVIALKNGSNPNIVAVNLSIGTSATFTAGNPACNAVDPTTGMLFAQLQALGVAPVVAAGNNGSDNSTSFPGCAPNAFTIGATDDADATAGFTNSSADLEWWAPGVSIDAPVPTDDNEDNKDGTSMATPHIVGAFALLRECVDGNGVPITLGNAVGDLNATGVNVTRNGVTRKRINILDAATSNVNNNDFASPETFVGDGPFDDFDFNVCADAEAGEPGPFSLDNSIWWTWTPATSGTATISTEDDVVPPTHATTFDSTLAVYTGNTLPTLGLVAADDDSGTGLRSLVRFPATAGTTYRIKVDGFAATNGLMNLHIDVGPPPSCWFNVATILGTPDSEVINGTAGNDVIMGFGGNDTINGLGGNDTICAGSGNDTVNGADGADFVLGEPGADTINGDAGNDTLVGNEGFSGSDDVGDVIRGGVGDDYIDAWVGNDIISGGAGNDQLKGMAGSDTADYSASPAGISANLTSNTATGEGSDTFVEVEHLVGSNFNDVLVGNAGNNVLRGLNGNDVLDGQGGNDALVGGNGNDVLVGRAGNDAFHGDAGVDTARFSASPAGVSASLLAGTAAGEGADTLANVENLIGSAFNDVLTGNGVPNVIQGLGGNDGMRGLVLNDVLDGGVGNDIMLGGLGNDLLAGRLGNDNYRGEAGVDTATFAASPAGVNASLLAGAAAGEGADALAGIENLTGSAFSDTLVGNAAGNFIDARSGNDGVFGLGFHDFLLGGDGNDVMRGGDGNDQLHGAAGNDRLFGENGVDHHNGGAGLDLCNGGLGLDSQVLCEVITLIP
jgi:Ca2+-binding RTX toxin-like protein